MYLAVFLANINIGMSRKNAVYGNNIGAQCFKLSYMWPSQRCLHNGDICHPYHIHVHRQDVLKIQAWQIFCKFMSDYPLYIFYWLIYVKTTISYWIINRIKFEFFSIYFFYKTFFFLLLTNYLLKKKKKKKKKKKSTKAQR